MPWRGYPANSSMYQADIRCGRSLRRLVACSRTQVASRSTGTSHPVSLGILGALRTFCSGRDSAWSVFQAVAEAGAHHVHEAGVLFVFESADPQEAPGNDSNHQQRGDHSSTPACSPSADFFMAVRRRRRRGDIRRPGRGILRRLCRIAPRFRGPARSDVQRASLPLRSIPLSRSAP